MEGEDYGVEACEGTTKSFCGSKYMTRVIVQGDLESCPHIAVSDAISANLAIQNDEMGVDAGDAIELSKQESVDCIPRPLPHCMGDVYAYARDYGLFLEEDYPYTADGKHPCKREELAARGLPKWGIRGRVRISSGSEAAKALRRFVLTASLYVHESFRTYTGGLIFPPSPEDEYLGLHAVVVLAYGFVNEDGVFIPYFVIKTNWKLGWGIKGYAKVHRKMLKNFSYPDHVAPFVQGN